MTTHARTHEDARMDARRNLKAMRRARRALWRTIPLNARWNEVRALVAMDALVADALERVDALEH